MNIPSLYAFEYQSSAGNKFDISMEDKLAIMKFIASYSGYSASSYKDLNENDIIGFGSVLKYNLDNNSSSDSHNFYIKRNDEIKLILENIPYVKYEELLQNKVILSKPVILKLFSIEFDRIYQFLNEKILNFSDISISKKAVLIDLVYLLKEPKFVKFKKFIQSCNNRNWSQASEELFNSNYYLQVTERAERNRQILLNENLNKINVTLEPNPNHFFPTLDRMFSSTDCLKFVLENNYETIYTSEMLSNMIPVSYQLAKNWLNNNPDKSFTKNVLGFEEEIKPEDIMYQFEVQLLYSLERRKKASFHDKVCEVLRTAKDARKDKPDHWSDKIERYDPYAALDFVTEIIDPLLIKCDALQLEREKERAALEKEKIQREVDRSVKQMERDVRDGKVKTDRTGHGRIGEISRTAYIVKYKTDFEKSIPSFPNCF